MSALYVAASGTRNGSSSLAGVRLSKIGWSGSARTSRACTAANRIVPNRIVRSRLVASGCRASRAAGSRMADDGRDETKGIDDEVRRGRVRDDVRAADEPDPVADGQDDEDPGERRDPAHDIGQVRAAGPSYGSGSGAPSSAPSVVTSCSVSRIGEASRSRGVTSNPAAGIGMATQPLGTRRQLDHPLAGGGKRGHVQGTRDRSGAADPVEVAGEDELAASSDEGEVVGTRTRRGDDLERHVAGRKDLQVGELANRVRQRATAARSHEDGDPQGVGDGLGAGRMVGIDVGERDGIDGAAARRPRARWRSIECRARSDRPDRRARTGVARRDTRRPADRRPRRRPASRSGSRPATRLVDLDRSERPGARRARISSIDRACSSCWRVVLVGSHIAEPAARPSPRARRSGAARRGPRPRRPRTSARRRPAAPRRRTGRRTGADSRAGSPSATAGRAGRSAGGGRDRRPRSRTSPSRAAAPTGRPRQGHLDAPTSASSTPASSNSSRIAATWAASAASGRQVAADRSGRRARATRPSARRASGSASAASTRPPGKTCMSGANAIVDGSMGQEGLETRRSRSKQDDGRRGARFDAFAAHPASGVGRRGGELGPQRVGIRDRQAADEAATDVGRRPAVDRDAVARATGRRSPPPGRRRRRRPGSAG